MSKSRNNAIAIGATEDETVPADPGGEDRLGPPHHLRPDRRPEVSNLVLLAALCLERDPHEVAEEIGDGGAAALKRS